MLSSFLIFSSKVLCVVHCPGFQSCCCNVAKCDRMDSALHLHMGGILSWVGGCKECARAAGGSPCVTARVACSGSRLGSVRMAVVVLRRRSELRTTEKNGGGKKKRSQVVSKVQIMFGSALVALDSLGLRAGREQCWSSQDRVDWHRSAALAVDTMPL